MSRSRSGGTRYGLHPDLVALKEDARSAKREEPDERAADRVLVAVAPAACETRVVVARRVPHRRRARRHQLFGAATTSASCSATNGACRKTRFMHSWRPSGTTYSMSFSSNHHIGLAEQQPFGVELPRDAAKAPVHVDGLGPSLVVLRPLTHPQPNGGSPGCAGGLSRSSSVLDERVRDVDAEAGDIALEPEAEDVVERGADVLVPPVEVRLLGQEVVQVVLAARRNPSSMPGRRTRTSSCSAASRRASGRARRTSRVWRGREPGMRVARVVRDEIEHHPDVAPLPRRSGARGRRASRSPDARRSSRRRRSPSPCSATGTSGSARRASTPSHSRWSSFAMTPGRSPIPSPFESAYERGYTW